MQLQNINTSSNLFSSLSLLAVVALTVLLYSPTLDAPFALDDYSNIVENHHLKIKSITPGTLARAATGINKHRWFPNMSFALNYYVHGQNVQGYHIVNICIHALTGIFLYFFAVFTLSRPTIPASIRSRKKEIALFATALWLFHPLQTTGVTYIVQRMTSMATMFYLASILCYAHARSGNNSPQKQFILYVLALVAGFMALFSKENAAFLPVTILVYDFFFLRDPDSPPAGKRNLFFPVAAIAMVLFAGLYFLGSDPSATLFEGYSTRNFSISERLMTQPRVIFQYLSLLFLPLPSRLNLNHDFQISTSLLDPLQTAPALFGIIGFVILSIVAARRHRLSSFAIFWFLGNLIIESTFLPLEIIFEHRVYLPSTFLILTLVAALYGKAKSPSLLNSLRTVLVGLLCITALLTLQRNAIWISAVSLWSDVVQKSPNLARPHINLGKALVIDKQFQAAEKHLKRGIELEPEISHAYINLAALLDKMGRYQESLTMSELALTKKDPDEARIHHNMAIVYRKLNDHHRAVTEINRALEINPYFSDAYVTLGGIYGLSGFHEKAVQLFFKAIEIDQHNGYAYQNLGTAYDRMNRLDESVRAYETALQKSNADPVKVHNNLGIVYWRMNQYDKSIDEARKALSLDPDFYDAYITLGITLEDMGNFPQAVEQYTEAWRRGYDMIGIYNQWSMDYLKRNQLERAALYASEAIRLNPDHWESHLTLSRIHDARGMISEAQKERDIAQTLKSTTGR
ncbi:tetratricopeptide repeat protein [Thermodesulfobacteriota bacterium]